MDAYRSAANDLSGGQIVPYGNPLRRTGPGGVDGKQVG